MFNIKREMASPVPSKEEEEEEDDEEEVRKTNLFWKSVKWIFNFSDLFDIVYLVP